MKQKNILNVVVFLVSFECFQQVTSRSYNNGLIFYDLQTFQAYLPPTVSVSRGRGLASVKFSEKGSIWSTFGKPCECRRNVCGCCAGINVKQYDFNQKMCANVTFVPPKEEALLEVYLNEKPSSKYGISVRNPSPFCIPVMMGIPMAMCVQMSDVAIKGNNLNMCMDFIVQLATTDLFEMHFQCMQMGLDGFQYIDKDGNPVIPPSNSKTEIDDDYYDYDQSDENEIGYAQANEQVDRDAITQQQQQTSNTIDASYIVGLQQQMQQLQDAHQIQIEKDDLVTQISHQTTLAPIVVEAETEMIAAITTAETATETAMETATDTAHTDTETEAEINATAVKAEAETETEHPLPTTTINSPNNELDLSSTASGSNYMETPTAAASTSTSTTEVSISKPIAAPINAYADTTDTSETISGVTVATAPFENVTTNYASDAFSTTDSDIDIETTTTVVTEDLMSGYISVPIAPTAVGATEVAAINSTPREAAASTEAKPMQDASFSSTNSPSSATPNVKEITTVADKTPEAPAITPAVDTSYRYLKRWFGH